MPRKLTDDVKRDIDELFRLYDADKTGTINTAELSTLLRALGLCPTNAEVRELMLKYDRDKSHDLTKEEFYALYCDDLIKAVDEEAALRTAFKTFDINGDGTISKEELIAALTTMGEPLSGREVNLMFDTVDLGGKGQLDFEAFRLLMLGKPDQRSWKSSRRSGETLQEHKFP